MKTPAQKSRSKGKDKCQKEKKHKCEITGKERKAGINIQDLIKE